jgi:hypothetical protein
VSQTLRYDVRKPSLAFPLVLRDPPEPLWREAAKRSRIWELAPSLHCSIIGTCLSTAELRRVLIKAGVAGRDASDHDLHQQGVRLAGQHGGPAKLLQKALDERHRLAIKQFARAGTQDELRALWRAARARGDIPGAYWAVLTHPMAGSLIGEAFGDVHMLSHLVGAANRADIRRLRTLEAEKAELEAKVLKQQEQLREAIVSRDARIRELSDLLASDLARETTEPLDPDAGGSERAALARLVADLECRLGRETHRRRLVEDRLGACRDGLLREREARVAAERRHAAALRELDAIEASMAGAPTRSAERMACAPQIQGMAILYVGGRPSQVGQVRALAERSGAGFLHHDGGTEENPALLPGLIGRADAVLFPVDCVSHAAAWTVKQLCRRAHKPYLPLRGGSVGSFLAALVRPEFARLAAPPGKTDYRVADGAAVDVSEPAELSPV